MTQYNHIFAIVCVVLIAIGQMMFKQTARVMSGVGTFVDRNVLALLFATLLLYGISSLLWVVLLQHAPLSRVYPYMALSFVLVPLGSWLIFNESISAGQIVGLGFIVIGIVVTAATT